MTPSGVSGPSRREWLRLVTAGFAGASWGRDAFAAAPDESKAKSPLTITGLKVTPIALPDPPLLFAGGCHGPYFLRNLVEIQTDAGIVGIGETVGGEGNTTALERARKVIVGQNAFGYRGFAKELLKIGVGCYAGIELACLDAVGKASGRRVCELLGGPVRDPVEFAAYLFYRYPADHPVVLSDPRIAAGDPRGTGSKALDAWGEVRSPRAMADLAEGFRERWGFRVFKLKAGVLPPDAERETLEAMAAKLGPKARLRIDPNGRWTVPTALRVGKAVRAAGLNLEYYEDPVTGQKAMAEVRRGTGLPMSTNMCVTSFAHLAEAFQVKPIDVLLADLHYFGGFAGCQALGPVADAAGWALSQHSNNHAGVTMAAMIHLAACIPQLTAASDTHYLWLPEGADILKGPNLTIRDGAMSVPAGPGLGVELDPDRVARANEIYRKTPMRRRDDAPLMRRLEPGWTGKPL
ncbi:MAG: enolase C-terminal domain-like protein [Isosphaeraceae bacterium]